MTGLLETGKAKAGRIFTRVGHGQVVSSKFFKKNFFVTGLVVILSIGYISVRFDCTTSQERIASLQRRIDVMSTDKQRERSLYMTLTRESSMQHLVDSLRLGLSIPGQRPQTISYDHE